jgi:hypothetical protein
MRLPVTVPQVRRGPAACVLALAVLAAVVALAAVTAGIGALGPWVLAGFVLAVWGAVTWAAVVIRSCVHLGRAQHEPVSLAPGRPARVGQVSPVLAESARSALDGPQAAPAALADPVPPGVSAPSARPRWPHLDPGMRGPQGPAER